MDVQQFSSYITQHFDIGDIALGNDIVLSSLKMKQSAMDLLVEKNCKESWGVDECEIENMKCDISNVQNPLITVNNCNLAIKKINGAKKKVGGSSITEENFLSIFFSRSENNAPNLCHEALFGATIKFNNLNIQIKYHSNILERLITLKLSIPELLLEDKTKPKNSEQGMEEVIEKRLKFKSAKLYLLEFIYDKVTGETIEIPLADTTDGTINPEKPNSLYIKLHSSPKTTTLDFDFHFNIVRFLVNPNYLQLLLEFAVHFFPEKTEAKTSNSAISFSDLNLEALIPRMKWMNREMNFKCFISKALFIFSYEQPKSIAMLSQINNFFDSKEYAVAEISTFHEPNITFSMTGIDMNVVSLSNMNLQINKFSVFECKDNEYKKILYMIKSKSDASPDLIATIGIDKSMNSEFSLKLGKLNIEMEIELYSRLINYIFVISDFWRQISEQRIFSTPQPKLTSTSYDDDSPPTLTIIKVSTPFISLNLIFPPEDAGGVAIHLRASNSSSELPILNIECRDFTFSTKVIPFNSGQEYEINFDNLLINLQMGVDAMKSAIISVSSIHKLGTMTPIVIQTKSIDRKDAIDQIDVMNNRSFNLSFRNMEYFDTDIDINGDGMHSQNKEYEFNQIKFQAMEKSEVALFLVFPQTFRFELEKHNFYILQSLFSSIPQILKFHHDLSLEKRYFTDHNHHLQHDGDNEEEGDEFLDVEDDFQDVEGEFSDRNDDNNDVFQSVVFQTSTEVFETEMMTDPTLTSLYSAVGGSPSSPSSSTAAVSFGFHSLFLGGTIKLYDGKISDNPNSVEIAFEDLNFIFGSNIQSRNGSSLLCVSANKIDVSYTPRSKFNDQSYHLFKKNENEARNMLSFIIERKLNADTYTIVSVYGLSINYTLSVNFLAFFNNFMQRTTDASSSSSSTFNTPSPSPSRFQEGEADLYSEQKQQSPSSPSSQPPPSPSQSLLNSAANCHLELTFENVNLSIVDGEDKLFVDIGSLKLLNQLEQHQYKFSFVFFNVSCYICKSFNEFTLIEKKKLIAVSDSLNVSIAFIMNGENESSLDITLDNRDLTMFGCVDSIHSALKVISNSLFTSSIDDDLQARSPNHHFDNSDDRGTNHRHYNNNGGDNNLSSYDFDDDDILQSNKKKKESVKIDDSKFRLIPQTSSPSPSHYNDNVVDIPKYETANLLFDSEEIDYIQQQNDGGINNNNTQLGLRTNSASPTSSSSSSSSSPIRTSKHKKKTMIVKKTETKFVPKSIPKSRIVRRPKSSSSSSIDDFAGFDDDNNNVGGGFEEVVETYFDTEMVAEEVEVEVEVEVDDDNNEEGEAMSISTPHLGVRQSSASSTINSQSNRGYVAGGGDDDDLLIENDDDPYVPVTSRSTTLNLNTSTSTPQQSKSLLPSLTSFNFIGGSGSGSGSNINNNNNNIILDQPRSSSQFREGGMTSHSTPIVRVYSEKEEVGNYFNIIDNYIEKKISQLDESNGGGGVGSGSLLPTSGYPPPNLRVRINDITVRITIFQGEDWKDERDENNSVSLELHKLSLHYDRYFFHSKLKSRMGVGIYDIIIKDGMEDSNWLTLFSYNEEVPRHENAKCFSMYYQSSVRKAVHIRSLKLKLLPITLNLEGNTLAFLMQFYQTLVALNLQQQQQLLLQQQQQQQQQTYHNLDYNHQHQHQQYRSQSPPFTVDEYDHHVMTDLAPPLILYDTISIDKLSFNLSIKPMNPSNLDYIAILFQGNEEVIKFFNLNIENAQIELPKVFLRNQKPESLFASIERIWDWRSRVPSQLLWGIGLLRSFDAYRRGFYDLVALPYTYTVDKNRPITGLRRGMGSFISNIGGETLLLIGKTSNGFLSLVDGFISEKPDTKSRYANPPKDTTEGVNTAVRMAAKRANDAIDKVFHTPLNEFHRSGTAGYFRSLAFGAPTAVLSPFVLVTEVLSHVSIGAYNSMHPKKLDVIKSKYKPQEHQTE